MRWLRSLFTSFIAFGLMSFVVPSVALADLYDLSADSSIALVNATPAQIVANVNQYIPTNNASMDFGSGMTLPLTRYVIGSGETYTTVTLSGSGTNSSNDSSVVTINESSTSTTSGTTSGTIDGELISDENYVPPGYVIDASYSSYDTQLTSTNGQLSGTVTTRSLGNFSGSGAGTATGSATYEGRYYWEMRPRNKVDISNFDKITLVYRITGFGTFPSGAPLLVTGFKNGLVLLHKDDGTNNAVRSNGDYSVMVLGQWAANERVQQSTSGRYIPSINYFDIYIIVSLSNAIAGSYDSVLIPYDWHVYRDMGYENTNQIGSDIGSQTTSINNNITQQTQNQTNQLKDTTGSDGILSVPKNVGTEIYEQVTFTNQIAGISSQLATTVASADASEGGFTLPSWEFQGQQIWPEMVVSPWTDIPIDIKSKIRLFNTMVFAILWIRSLWNWIASIFGFEQVDDSGGSFDDMFDDDDGYSGFDYNAASKRSNDMMKKLGYYH